MSTAASLFINASGIDFTFFSLYSEKLKCRFLSDLRLIKENFPEENVEGISLTDVMFDKSGCYDAFALGYYVGESPAGELYLLVSFDEEFEANREVICEAY